MCDTLRIYNPIVSDCEFRLKKNNNIKNFNTLYKNIRLEGTYLFKSFEGL